MTTVGLGFLVGPLAFGFVADHQGYFMSWMLVVASSLASAAGFLRIERAMGRVREGRAGAGTFPAAGNEAGF